MSDSKAYKYSIKLSGSGQDEQNMVHQISPSWVLTVVRWAYRDTLRITNVQNIFQTLPPLIIVNDCISVSVDSDKNTLTPSFNAVLKITDTNYLTAIGPGDFVFINMLNWEADANRVYDKIGGTAGINGFNDGFKGFFKVQGVRGSLNVDPVSGVKEMHCKINGYAFTEFNNSIYYNPNVLNKSVDEQQLVFISNFGEVFRDLVNERGVNSVQNIIATLIQSFIGTGPTGTNLPGVLTPSKNTQFLMPQKVGDLLGIPNVTSAKDVYNYIFGIQSFAGNLTGAPGVGFNPTGLSNANGTGFKFTPTICQGQGLLKPEYWNQVKAWNIINQYSNSPLNELYTCFRVDTNGSIRPTVVLRQIPFTSETFVYNNALTTRFMTVPRWVISPTLVTGMDIGRDDAARINFVQCYAQSMFGSNGVAVSFETAMGNYIYDQEDVKRSGLRPYIFSSTFDEIPKDKDRLVFSSPVWAKIVGDSLIGGHLKLNGTLTCIGIVEPIAPGDNLEFNNVVYHIEQVNHSCVITSEGRKQFRTTLSLSHGVSIASAGLTAGTDQGDKYAEMQYTSAFYNEKADNRLNQILPGIAEAQDIPSRNGDIDIPNNGNYSFPQPNTPIIIEKSNS